MGICMKKLWKKQGLTLVAKRKSGHEWLTPVAAHNQLIFVLRHIRCNALCFPTLSIFFPTLLGAQHVE